MKSDRCSARTMRGFTVIDLLVLVAIIGIIAALMLPALARAKASAKSAACKSNFRQIGLALSLYVDDFAQYPWSQARVTNGGAMSFVSWVDLLRPYCCSNDNVFRCPGAGAIYDMNEGGSGEDLGLAGVPAGPNSSAPTP